MDPSELFSQEVEAVAAIFGEEVEVRADRIVARLEACTLTVWLTEEGYPDVCAPRVAFERGGASRAALRDAEARLRGFCEQRRSAEGLLLDMIQEAPLCLEDAFAFAAADTVDPFVPDDAASAVAASGEASSSSSSRGEEVEKDESGDDDVTHHCAVLIDHMNDSVAYSATLKRRTAASNDSID